MLIFCIAGAPHGAMQVGEPLLVTSLFLVVPLSIPALYFHQHGLMERRDAAWMLPWTLVTAALIAQTAVTAATFTFPLRDSLWYRLDRALHVNVPLVMAAAARHPILQHWLEWIYRMVHPMLVLGIFLPMLFGKRHAAQRFLLANAISFVIALPCMVFLPAIGPWVSWGFAPNLPQSLCQAGILTLRHGAIPVTDLFGGTVCLPSFHVFWAVVAAHALQPFRLLYYPAILLAALIAVSTITTGWHYGVDVIAGVFLAWVCTGIATSILRTEDVAAHSREAEVRNIALVGFGGECDS